LRFPTSDFFRVAELYEFVLFISLLGCGTSDLPRVGLEAGGLLEFVEVFVGFKAGTASPN